MFVFNVHALEAIMCTCGKCLYFLGEGDELWEIKASARSAEGGPQHKSCSCSSEAWEFMILTASPPRSSDWLLIGRLISRLANRRESEPNLYSVSACCKKSVIKQLFYSVLFGAYF